MSDTDVDQQRPTRLRWWKEATYVALFYGVYSVVRNLFGSDEDAAFDHALQVIDWERALGLYHEEAIQQWFLDTEWFVRFWNVFYGAAHFVVTIGVMLWLFRRFPGRYPRWRNTLGWTTALALVGFATYPLMPPRLLPESFGYVDTLAEIGGLWSFDEGPIAEVSNQYAAMPSLHFAWSTWCALALVPVVRSAWGRAAYVLYPVATLFAIVVTANHFWIDAVGGALVLALGYLLGSAQEEWRQSRSTRSTH
jgi:hypothetical protein